MPKKRGGHIKKLFLFTLVYLAAAILIMATFREDWVTSLRGIIASSRDFFDLLRHWVIYIGLAAAVLIVSVGLKTMKLRIENIVFAVLVCALFPSAFSLIKTTLPHIIPFFADPYLANFDNWLHFGVDPWRIAYKVSDYLPHEFVILSYTLVWGIQALFFPIFLAAADGDGARVRQYLILYVVAWVGIGNIGALAGMSVGPVYYDRLLGGDRFAELTQALQETGVTQSAIGQIQQNLWMLYKEQSQSIVSGISAFPSVHVSVTVVTALYMFERSKWLFAPAAVFYLSVLFISVFSGYHYAIDGYFSTAVIVGLWAWMRRATNVEKQGVF